MTTITANDMYAAQSYRPTAEERADMVARADAMREITGTSGLKPIVLEVHTTSGALIGHLRYSL